MAEEKEEEETMTFDEWWADYTPILCSDMLELQYLAQDAWHAARMMPQPEPVDDEHAVIITKYFRYRGQDPKLIAFENAPPRRLEGSKIYKVVTKINGLIDEVVESTVTEVLEDEATA